MKLNQAIQLLKNMGLRYVVYRVQHEVEKKTGRLKKKFPVEPSKKSYASLSEWRKTPNAFDLPNIGIRGGGNDDLKKEVTNIFEGKILFFSKEWKHLGEDYDWVCNPDSGYKYPMKHWSEIPDFSAEIGDIKYVWEKSRFTYFQTVLRHDVQFESDSSEWLFSQMDSWIAANPINQGPNWRCSQEISLRLLNWYFVLSFYRQSENLTESRWASYEHVIYWQLHHVYSHIDFSRIAVRNNHAITETGILFISKSLFPFFPDTKKWSLKGKAWLEQEVAYQVYEDGTFLQFSMNYHRVLVQLLTLFIRISEHNGLNLSNVVLDRAYESLKFLLSCQDTITGHLPNYGANDGALFFKWTSTDFRDYRPQLNSLHKLLTGQVYYRSNETVDEDSIWMVGSQATSERFTPIIINDGMYRFEIGGYYIIREEEVLSFLRCGNHKDRPSQADNLHLDIWVKGVNILRDAGSYKYNTEPGLVNYFMGSKSHNTVLINGESQMKKGSRFIWYYWTQSLGCTMLEMDDSYVIIAKITAFEFLGYKVMHERRIVKPKNTLEWEIQDEVSTKDNEELKAQQIWHSASWNQVHLEANVDGNWIGPTESNGYYSGYYGLMESSLDKSFQFTNSITTKIIYKNSEL